MLNPLRSRRRSAVGLGLLVSGVLVACEMGSDADLANRGEILLTITSAPADVSCIVIEVTGTRVVERAFDVTTSESTELTMGGLPVGDVVVDGDAFDVACATVLESDVPTWQGGPVAASLVGGDVTPVTLPMRRNARAVVAVDFEEDATCLSGGAACATSEECCSLVCTSGGDGGTGTCENEPVCGDGLLDPGEQCDDGGDSVTCDADCTATACGDGHTNLTAGEECDDGNLVDGDGCSATCSSETSCGDGTCEGGEDCTTCSADCGVCP